MGFALDLSPSHHTWLLSVVVKEPRGRGEEMRSLSWAGPVPCQPCEQHRPASTLRGMERPCALSLPFWLPLREVPHTKPEPTWRGSTAAPDPGPS